MPSILLYYILLPKTAAPGAPEAVPDQPQVLWKYTGNRMFPSEGRMAGFQAVPNCIQGQFQFTVAGQQCINNVYYRKATPATQQDCQNLAQALTTTYWVGKLQPLVTPDFFMSSIVATALDSPTAPVSGVDMVAGQTNGTGQGMAVPTGSALVGTMTTAERSRNGRGRIYLAGMPSGQLSNPTEVANNYLLLIIEALGALLTVATATSTALVVVSRIINKVQRPTGVPITVTQITADRYLDSQRRRLHGRGT